MVSFKEIVKSLEARWFMSSMATGAVGIGLNFLVKSFSFIKYISSFLVILAILFFVLASFFYLLRLFIFPKEVIRDLKHPIINNFFAGIYISIGVLITGILNVLIPNGLSYGLGILISKILYVLGLLLIIFLIIAIPSIDIVSENVDTRHSLGIWFLPPVGLFVFIFAGNFLAMKGVFVEFIKVFNSLLIGLAFVWWFLRLNFIFYRAKFHPLPPPEMAPSFVIGLAPIGVSVIATQTFANLLNNQLLKQIVDGFGVLIYGFGLWWALITLIILTYYFFKHKIPYSLGFWAFVFPPAAFGIGAKLLSTLQGELSKVFDIIYLISITIATLVWLFVVYKTIKSIYTGKAFQRPKALQK